MKMKTLLAGVAAVALTAGAASAQVASQISQGEFTTVANTSGTPSAGDIRFATELGSLAGVTVPAEFQITPRAPATAFESSPNVEVLLTVNITGAVLDRSLVDADIVGSGANCTTSDLTVDANGAAGQSTVTFRIADIAECDTVSGFVAGGGPDNFQFALPLILSGGDVDITYEMRRASNNALITSGSWSANETNATWAPGAIVGPFIGQTSAVTVTATPGTAVAALPTYLAFSDPTAGSLNLAFSGAFKADRTAVGAGDVSGASSSYSCTFASGAGLTATGHTFVGTNAAAAATSNPVPFGVVGGDFGATVPLSLAASGAAAIQPQDIACSGSIGFTAASGLSARALSFSGGNIRRAGATSDVFEWVGQAGSVTRNIFRATGFGATAPGASVIISNSSAGLDGEYNLTLPAPTNGEIIITESHLSAAAGNFGRADVQFSFQTSTPSGIIVRRLMVGNNGTLTDFGNENDDGTNFMAPPIAPTDTVGGGDN